MMAYIALAAYFGSWFVLFVKSLVLMIYNINADIVTDWFSGLLYWDVLY